MNLPHSSGSSAYQPHSNKALFQGGRNLIQGGQFVQYNHTQALSPSHHNCAEVHDGLTHLNLHVATAAFDGKDKVDAPKCHPNTRIAVLDEIMAWIQVPAMMRVLWIMWLNGAAGAGKSAIARSIIELCRAQNIPLAAFFFFRTDPTRNTIDPIVATIVHQLIFSIPELEEFIVPKITRDPLIFTKSLETQFTTLVFEPLQQFHQAFTFTKTLVLLFDGVDELTGAGNQVALIKLLAGFVASKAFPVVVFFGSRTETQLRQAFASRSITPLLKQVPLDNNYQADDDTRRFLDDSFAEIRETHPFSPFLDAEWPVPAHVDEIVRKSSGQFVYVSVVVKFISAPNTHPAQQLDIIRGLQPAGTSTPFEQLDALYRHIFSQVPDINNTLYLLAVCILCGMSTVNHFQSSFPHCFQSSSLIASLVLPLSSVMNYKDQEIFFLHASLPDFLLDRARSQEYFIDAELWATRLAMEHEGTIISYFVRLLRQANGTPELRDKLAHHYLLSEAFLSGGNNMMAVVSIIHRLNFDDGGDLFRLVLKRVATVCMMGVDGNVPNHADEILSTLKERYDLSQILEEIEGDIPGKHTPADRLVVDDALHSICEIEEQEVASCSPAIAHESTLQTHTPIQSESKSHSRLSLTARAKAKGKLLLEKLHTST